MRHAAESPSQDRLLSGRLSGFDTNTPLLLLLLLLLLPLLLLLSGEMSVLVACAPPRLRPIFKLRISEFGVWVKQILKRRRWAFLARRLIS